MEAGSAGGAAGAGRKLVVLHKVALVADDTMDI